MADLEIRNLHVAAGDKQILKGVDLHVRSGEIHAMMGPNGSGKSTLANVIMGHPGLEVTEGQILFNGEEITEADPDERARAGLFMAFQYPLPCSNAASRSPTSRATRARCATAPRWPLVSTATTGSGGPSKPAARKTRCGSCRSSSPSDRRSRG